MIKPEKLREILSRTIALFEVNPEKLVLQYDNGIIKINASNSPSFEYHYDLLISVKDYPQHPDTIFVPVVDFIKREQWELVQNKENWDKVKFDLEPLNNKTYNIYIKIPLTERVIAKAENDSYNIYHGKEPQAPDTMPLNKFKIYLVHPDNDEELIFDSEQQANGEH